MKAEEIASRLCRVRLLIADVDGVLTDGRIIYGDYGDEIKSFDTRDGQGIELLRAAGIPTVLITGRKSRTNNRRARELRVARLFQGAKDKLKFFFRALRKFHLTQEECCVIGDDLPDLPLLRRAGFSVAVPHAVSEVKRAAHYVTRREGGRGAVREVADEILRAQGKWEEAASRFLV